MSDIAFGAIYKKLAIYKKIKDAEAEVARLTAERDRYRDWAATCACEQGRSHPIESGAYPSECRCIPCRARKDKGE